jgi:hypothetical protein
MWNIWALVVTVKLNYCNYCMKQVVSCNISAWNIDGHNMRITLGCLLKRVCRMSDVNGWVWDVENVESPSTEIVVVTQAAGIHLWVGINYCLHLSLSFSFQISQDSWPGYHHPNCCLSHYWFTILATSKRATGSQLDSCPSQCSQWTKGLDRVACSTLQYLSQFITLFKLLD